MLKFSRTQRISAITKILMENPNRVIGLNYFTELLNAAKSTTSEDIVIVRDMLHFLDAGTIETVAGAAGGVKYIVNAPENLRKNFPTELCEILSDKNRIITGNFLYMTDILANPDILQKAALLLASTFKEEDLDYVITVETKGIPLAYEVAKLLGIQLVIVRRDSKVTEGTTISINYLSGSSKRIQSMSLSKKSLKKGSKCIFIDDFMKAGGTALGITELLREFECELKGIGVLIDNNEVSKKLVDGYVSIVKYNGIDEQGNAVLKVSDI